jgi:cell division septal protein FtsQ
MKTLRHQKPSLFQRALQVVCLGVVGGILLTGVGLAGHTAVNGENFQVYRVVFEGNQRSTNIELRHLSDIRRDTHLLSVDIDTVAQSVAQHPWVSRVHVQRTYPSTITVSVTEHEPLLLLALDSMWYVDASGTPFKQAQSNDLNYPVLTGMTPYLVEKHPAISTMVIQHTLEMLDASTAPPINGIAAVSEVNFSKRHGFSLVLRSGTQLEFGFTNPIERMSRLQQMVDRGLSLDSPQRVDLNSDLVAIATPLPPLPPL